MQGEERRIASQENAWKIYISKWKKKKDISGGKDWQDAQTEAIILYFRNLPSSLKKKKTFKNSI